MAIPAISHGIAVLLFCQGMTLASSNDHVADNQNASDNIIGESYVPGEADGRRDFTGEDDYVYIDDDGRGAQFQYGNRGDQSELDTHMHDDNIEEEDMVEECRMEEAGAQNLMSLACDIEIRGADEQREGNIPWGIDGIYQMIGCYSGTPVYKRHGKTHEQRRFLWFSSVFKDWDVGLGDFHRDQINRPPLMFGASSPVKERPELLGDDAWQVMDVYQPEQAGFSYSAVKVSVECVKPSSTPEINVHYASQELTMHAAAVLRSSESTIAT